MGRRFPANDNHLIHPLLSYALLAAGMAAAISIISGLCGVRHRRKSSPPPSPIPAPKKKAAVSQPRTTIPSSTTTTTMTTKKTPTTKPSSAAELTENQNELLMPDPPEKKNKKTLVREAYSSRDMTRLESERKIAASLSMRVTRSLSMARNNNDNNKKRGNKMLTSEDSIWMKTIILGEKCRVPDEEEEGVIYEEQGRRISAYHPRTASALSISRQCSFGDRDAIPRYMN